jgi:hypothetical protein
VTLEVGHTHHHHQEVPDVNNDGSDTKVNNDGWIDPHIDNTQLNINGTSASALLAAMFNLGEQSANLGRESSMMSTHNSLSETQRNLADLTKATHETYKSEVLAGVGQLVGSVASVAVGGGLTASGKMASDTAFSVSGNIAGVTSSSFALGANPSKQEAGLAQADGQVATTYENLDQKWSDNSTGAAATIMEKIQSVNEALANIVGQSAQTRSSSY